MNSTESTSPVEYPTFVINDVTYSLRMTLAAACQFEKDKFGVWDAFKVGDQQLQNITRLFGAMVGTVDEKGDWHRVTGDPMALAEHISIRDMGALTEAMVEAIKTRPAGTTTQTLPAEPTGLPN